MGASLGGLGGSVNFSTLQPTLSWMTAAATLGRQLRALQLLGGRDGLARQARRRGADGQPSQSRAWSTAISTSMRAACAYVHDGDSTISGNLHQRALRVRRHQLADRDVHELRPATPTSSACATTAIRRRRCPAATARTTPTTATCSSTRSPTTRCSARRSCRRRSSRSIRAASRPAGALRQRPARRPAASPAIRRSTGYSVNATLPAQQRHTISIQAYGIVVAVRDHAARRRSRVPYLQRLARRRSTTCCRPPTRFTPATSLRWPDRPASARRPATAASPSSPASAATWQPTHARHLQRVVRAGRRGGDAGTLADSQRSGVAALRLQRQCRVRQRAGPEAAEQLVDLGARGLHAPAARRQRLADALSPGAKRRAAAGLRQRRRCSTQLGQLPSGLSCSRSRSSTTRRRAATRRRARRSTAQQLYFTTPVAGVQRLYQGAELTGYLTLGDLVIQPYYNLTGAQANSTTLHLRQSAFDHDSGPAAAQRAAAKGGTRARLQSAAFDLSSGWPTRNTSARTIRTTCRPTRPSMRASRRSCTSAR